MLMTQAKGKALYQEVVNQICEMILSGAIPAGEFLPSENTLCDRMGVSRTTVREALHILEEREIIKKIKGKGSMVVSDDFHYVDESVRSSLLKYQNSLENVVEARMIIEPSIARLACQTATEQDILDMRTVIEDCNKKNLNGTATSADLRIFHVQVARACHNPILESFVEMMIEMCDAPAEANVTAPNPDFKLRPGIIVSHTMILEAIADGRDEDAYFYMKENIKEFYHNTLEEIASGA